MLGRSNLICKHCNRNVKFIHTLHSTSEHWYCTGMTLSEESSLWIKECNNRPEHVLYITLQRAFRYHLGNRYFILLTLGKNYFNSLMVSDRVHLSHCIALHCIVGFQERAVVHWLLSVFTSTTHSKRSVSSDVIAMWADVGESHSVWCIFYLQLIITHGLCKIYCKPWCTLFSSLRNCFLAPGSEWTSITGGQDAVRNCNGQSSRRNECWTPQEEPEKSSISTEEPEEPHRSSPRGP